ncbi:YHYH protein [Neotamlana laminarinivorans]|uniref:YHYH protein n=1 Tax=Neotamlana laminarinivorans TaxID=2883124 RepID=A0A9X1L3R4_9FLAO|nr:YHYH protein [Tamlana laminarinivorans]MCB4798734.1 YHYH protein [Tamlana laminarinivorans]
MKTVKIISLLFICFLVFSCKSRKEDQVANNESFKNNRPPRHENGRRPGPPPGGGGRVRNYVATDSDEAVEKLHPAFEAFNKEATDIFLSNNGRTVTIETTGLPDHETIYWGKNHELYRDEPSVERTPSIMSSNNNAITLVVDAVPNLTGKTINTNMGTIGIAVSGASIFNDQEGGGALDRAAASLDWTGGHIGPGVYHYHLEPKAFSYNDDKLVGILRDGVFIYGRKCFETGDYPTNLDASGGHTGITQHSNGKAEYHYHIINELYSTTGSYIVFAGPYQGY